MKNVITVDGRQFNVSVVEVSRTCEIEEGDNSDTLMSGRYKRDIKGTMLSYNVTFGTSALSPQDYDDLFEILSSPQEYHTISIPYGQGEKTFSAYITNVSDALKRVKTAYNHWDSLSVSFKSISPIRFPQEA